MSVQNHAAKQQKHASYLDIWLDTGAACPTFIFPTTSRFVATYRFRFVWDRKPGPPVAGGHRRVAERMNRSRQTQRTAGADGHETKTPRARILTRETRSRRAGPRRANCHSHHDHTATQPDRHTSRSACHTCKNHSTSGQSAVAARSPLAEAHWHCAADDDPARHAASFRVGWPPPPPCTRRARNRWKSRPWRAAPGCSRGPVQAAGRAGGRGNTALPSAPPRPPLEEGCSSRRSGSGSHSRRNPWSRRRPWRWR